MTKSLEFRWTVSKGRDTYGYNICSLWVDGVKVSSCNGGGYDMQGTAFAEWLQDNFQDRLQQPNIANKANWTVRIKVGKTGKRTYRKRVNFYGMGRFLAGSAVSVELDGGG